MKKVFFLLLAVNVLFAVVMSFQSEQQEPVSVGVFPEKIVLLPDSVACAVLGDFTEQEVEQVEDALNQVELPRRYKKVSAKAIVRYWVHTDPFTDRQTVEREINKLRNMGIISYRVQEEGKWLNAISFGEFRNASTANKLLETLNDKIEISAMIHEYEIRHKKFLIFEIDHQKMSELHYLTELFPNSNLEQTTCERL
ncbi:MAG: hypothetical protein KDF59_16515 [Nitrosomonas sp.]|nr:hypothetical protein [Nitrosomonas sp.]